MRIAVLGTGVVGRAIAGRSAEVGHEVVVGTRSPEVTLARTEDDARGNPPFRAWQAEHPDVALRPFRDAAANAEVVVNATSGDGSIAALEEAGADNLAGKVLIDVANPLDFSAGFPPTLLVKDTDSLAEQIQRAFPDARVVKTLNTVNAGVMVDPQGVGGGDHTVFVSGDDTDAKAVATDLLRSFGWRDVVDLGDLSSARGAEMILPIWVRLMGTLGTPMFNFKVVR